MSQRASNEPSLPGHDGHIRPRAADFLAAIFDGLDGHIEVRLIEDRKGGKPVVRQWYASPTALVDDLPRLLKIAENRTAAVFYGVLPRPDGKGKSVDALPGRIIWIDLDFKDFEGGKAEARLRLGEFPITPSIIIRSGHGLHVFWLLREPEDAGVLSHLSKGLARVLGGDHTFDAARLLRLPGSFNRKDPENPILVEIEHLDPERAYNVSKIEEALNVLGWDPGQEGTAKAETLQVQIGGGMSDRVLALLDTKPRIRGYFEGRGKPRVNAKGREMDQSSSGYDFSLALELAILGVTDPDEIATAIACRPDGSARKDGAAYIALTVEKALARAASAASAQGAPGSEIDFEVEQVRIFTSDHPVHEFVIDGKSFRLTSSQLKSPAAFGTAFLDIHRRIPRLPKQREPWISQVNAWLEGAIVEELGDDASDEAALREAIQAVIADMPEAEQGEDLDRGLAQFLENGRRAFKVDPILVRLRDSFPDLRRADLCRVLHELGYSPHTRRAFEKGVRLWA